MKIRLSTVAENDMVNGFWFYERQESGAGDYFRSSVGADIESLNIYAGIHPKIHGYHRKICKTFPYNVYYRLVSENRLEVVAVIAHRENRIPE